MELFETADGRPIKILAPSIEGYIEWAMPGEKGSIARVVRETLAFKSLTSNDDLLWNEAAAATTQKKYGSVGWWQLPAVMKWLLDMVETDPTAMWLLYFTGKSKGATKVMEALLNETWLYVLFARVAANIADLHSNIPGDGVLGPYKKGRDLVLPELCHKMQADGRLRVANVFQQHAEPTGARIIGAREETGLTGVKDITHFNIIDDLATRRMLTRNYQWLITGGTV